MTNNKTNIPTGEQKLVTIEVPEQVVQILKQFRVADKMSGYRERSYQATKLALGSEAADALTANERFELMELHDEFMMLAKAVFRIPLF